MWSVLCKQDTKLPLTDMPKSTEQIPPKQDNDNQNWATRCVLNQRHLQARKMPFTLGNRVGVTRINRATHPARHPMTWNQVSKWEMGCYHHTMHITAVEMTFNSDFGRASQNLHYIGNNYTSICYLITNDKHNFTRYMHGPWGSLTKMICNWITKQKQKVYMKGVKQIMKRDPVNSWDRCNKVHDQ